MSKRSPFVAVALLALYGACDNSSNDTPLPCGQPGQVCCTNPTPCTAGLACSAMGICTGSANGNCGKVGQPCCPNSTCTGGEGVSCVAGSCQSSACAAGALWSMDRCPCALSFVVGGVVHCTQECDTSASCPGAGAGNWSCSQNLDMGINVCSCTPSVSANSCSDPAADTDCDGVLDAHQAKCACPMPGQIMCTMTCVDPQKDNNNCGGCNTRCTHGTVCTAGKCACPPGITCAAGDGGV